MEITTDLIKELRAATKVSVMQCKKALVETEGDIEKAKILLRKLSAKSADKKSDRELGAGVVSSYIHGNGSVGAMVELLCETDFVSNNEEFKKIGYDIAMQVAANSPEFITSEEIKEEDKAKATELFKEEASDKPSEMQEKIIQGKLDSYFGEKTLMNQSFIKNPEQTITNVIEEASQKFGEKVIIGRVERFSISG